MTVEEHFVVAGEPASQTLLLVGEGGTWSLPHWRPESELHWKHVAPINQAVQRLLGCPAITLHAGLFVLPELRHRLCYMELLGRPQRGEWVDAQQARGLTLAWPEHREVLDAWFADVATRTEGADRSPWSQRGWYRDAAAWLCETAGLAGPVEQYRMWPGTCLLRAGHVYLKAVATPFSAEPLLTPLLEAEHPGQVPHLLAHHTGRGWFLLEDFGVIAPVQEAEWGAWLESYARLQLRWIPDTETLLRLGCQDHRTPRLLGALDRMLADRHVLCAPGGLSREELAALQLHSIRLKRDFSRLGVPETLVHGDLHVRNVAWRNGRLFLYDWSEAAITHPFFSFHQLCAVLPEGVREAYLAPWRERYGGAVDENFALTARLYPLYEAAATYSFMMQLPPRERMVFGPAIPQALQALLVR
ncbi:MAG: phosphotransferase [Candidatus Xenobia bacterium]